MILKRWPFEYKQNLKKRPPLFVSEIGIFGIFFLKYVEIKFSRFAQSKGNHTLKLYQLIKYNYKNAILQKSCRKCGGKSIPRRSFKMLKLGISLDEKTKVLFSLF